MTGVTGLNHVTLAVRDLDRAITFYGDLLGFALRAKWASGAYLDAGSLWLCLAVEDGPVTVRDDDTHIAFSCDTEDFEALSRKVAAASEVWKENKSEGASLYFLDPDGHKLELHLGSLESRLQHYRAHPEIGVDLL